MPATPLELCWASSDRLGLWDAGYVTATMTDAHSGADGPSPEDPTRFPEEPEIAPLDETPDGRTPSEPDESSDDSLPPGAG